MSCGLWYLYGVNRVVAATLIALAAGGGFALWLASGGPPVRGPTPEQDAAPAPASSNPRVPVEALPTTGTLVVRLVVSDGSAVPPEARAGYERFGARRLRPAGADGTYRFTDVPVGPLEIVAETPGRKPARAPFHLVPGVPGETILVLPAPGSAETETPPPPAPGGPADMDDASSPGGPR